MKEDYSHIKKFALDLGLIIWCRGEWTKESDGESYVFFSVDEEVKNTRRNKKLIEEVRRFANECGVRFEIFSWGDEIINPCYRYNGSLDESTAFVKEFPEHLDESVIEFDLDKLRSFEERFDIEPLLSDFLLSHAKKAHN